MGQLAGHLLNGLAFGSLLFLVASGLTLAFGLLRALNLAHGAFFLLGGYLALEVLGRGGSYWLALAVAVVTVGALGAVVERTLLHRVLGEELPQVVLTIGVAFLVADQVLGIWGGRPRRLPRPPGTEGGVELLGTTLPVYRAGLMLVAVALLGAITLVLARTRLGAMVRAAVDDEPVARAVGVPVPTLAMGVFGAGAALAAFAGVWGGAFTGMQPGAEMSVLLLALVVVVLGGLGSVGGAFAAAMVVGVVDQLGRWLFPELHFFTIYAPVALLLALRPRGLWGVAPRHGAEAGRLRQVTARMRPTDPDRPSRRRRLGWLLVVVALVALVALPWLVPTWWVSAVTRALVVALLATGFNLVFGLGGMPSLGHAAMFGVAAYAVGLGTVRLDWSLPTMLLAALVAGVGVGAAMGWLARRSQGIYLLVLTLAAAQALWGLAMQQRGVTRGDSGLPGISREVLGVVPEPLAFYHLVLAVTVVAGLVLWRTWRSTAATALACARDSPERARALGIDVERMRVAAFALSGAVAATAGVLEAFRQRFVGPDVLGWELSAVVLIAAVLGGSRAFLGPAVGAGLIVLAETAASTVTERWMSLLGAALIAAVLFLPGGLAGLGALAGRGRVGDALAGTSAPPAGREPG